GCRDRHSRIEATRRGHARDPENGDHAADCEQDTIGEAQFDRTAVPVRTRTLAHSFLLPQTASDKLAMMETASNANLVEVNREAMRLTATRRPEEAIKASNA